MVARDVWVVGGFALGTLLVNAALFLPGSAVADGPAAEAGMRISQPVLRVGLCEVAARFTPTTLKIGDAPKIELTARNDGKEDATLALSLALDAPAGPASAVGRRLPMPRRLWASTCPVSVAAGQTATRTLETGVALSAPAVTLTLSEGKESVTIPEVAVAPSPPAPPVASSDATVAAAATSPALEGPEPPAAAAVTALARFGRGSPRDDGHVSTGASPPAWVLAALPLGLLAWFAAGRRRETPFPGRVQGRAYGSRCRLRR